MQAVISGRWELHGRIAQGVAGATSAAPPTRKAGSGRAESAVAAQATAKRSAILLVRWKVIDAFPKVGARCWPLSLGALQRACAAARVIHHAGVTRCGCSITADVRIKSAARPRANYAPMLRSCNGSRQHFPNVACAQLRSKRKCETTRFDSALCQLEDSEKEQMRASASSVVERDRTARSGEAPFNGVASLTPRSLRPSEADVARPGAPAGRHRLPR